jgi:hypothetical protein
MFKHLLAMLVAIMRNCPMSSVALFHWENQELTLELLNSQIEEDLPLKQCHITKIHGSLTLLSRPPEYDVDLGA